MPVPAHRHRETFSHLIGSYGYIFIWKGSQPFIYRCAPRGTRTGSSTLKSEPKLPVAMTRPRWRIMRKNRLINTKYDIVFLEFVH